MSTLVTTQSVTDAFRDWIRETFKGITYQTPTGERKELSVYGQNLPVPSGNDEDADIELSSVPYIIAHVTDGKVLNWNGSQKINVILLLCTYDGDTAHQGHQDILSMKEKLLAAILKRPIVGPCEIELPIDWALSESDQYPFYFGAVSFTANTRTIFTKEDALA